MAKKTWYVPKLADATRLKYRLGDFVRSWVEWSNKLAARINDPSNPKDKRFAEELRDMKGFLLEVAALPSSTEFASATAPERSEYASAASKTLVNVDAALAKFDMADLKRLM